MSSDKATPQSNPKKKRPLSSPADQADQKKTKPVSDKENTGFTISEEAEAGISPTQITLSEDNLAQISVYLRSSFENELPTLVSSIVEGVVNSLSEKIKQLSDENAQLKRRVEELETKVDRAEQYSRRNCLRLSGIPETDGESVDDTVLQIATDVESGISLTHIDRTHRLGKPRQSGQGVKPRDIIIKFTSYRARQKLLKNKSKLKSKGYNNVFVNENLTALRDIFFQTRKLMRERLISSTWTSDGTIIVKDNQLKMHRLETHRDLERLKSSVDRV